MENFYMKWKKKLKWNQPTGQIKKQTKNFQFIQAKYH